MSKIRRQTVLQGLLFLPLVAITLLIFAYPMVRTIWLSFFSTSFGSARPPEYVGLKNYLTIFKDPLFLSSIGTTLLWVVLNLLVQLTVPIGIALILKRNLVGINAARALSLLPWIVPTVPIAVVLRLILLPKIGILSEFFKLIGFGSKNFLGQPFSAMIVLVITNSWQFLPFGTLMILSALQTIPDSLYEAARVDGCNAWNQFRFITFPYIGQIIWFVGFLAFAWNFNTFELIQLTTRGGPGRATDTLPLMIYRSAFRTFRLGEAAAIATIAGVVMIMLGIVYFKKMSPKDEFSL